MAVVIRRRQGGVAANGLPRCSFCLKPQSLVKKLIAGPSAFICNECVTVCNEIVSRDS
ncbi:MAG TPA: ClpX C4-type zinc finger protein, partial [Blastocatellia bacterium]|nr:ClpX C4-type zinc finger protein [Blastocatellia bacterium]